MLCSKIGVVESTGLAHHQVSCPTFSLTCMHPRISLLACNPNSVLWTLHLFTGTGQEMRVTAVFQSSQTLQKTQRSRMAKSLKPQHQYCLHGYADSTASSIARHSTGSCACVPLCRLSHFPWCCQCWQQQHMIRRCPSFAACCKPCSPASSQCSIAWWHSTQIEAYRHRCATRHSLLAFHSTYTVSTGCSLVAANLIAAG